MKKIVLCLAIMMAFGVGAVGCSKEKQEEVKPKSMVEEGVNKVTEAPPAMNEKAQLPADAGTNMGHDATQGVAPDVAAPVAGTAGQADETGKPVVQEGAGAVPGVAGDIKQETDQAVEALPEGAGDVVDEEAGHGAGPSPK